MLGIHTMPLQYLLVEGWFLPIGYVSELSSSLVSVEIVKSAVWPLFAQMLE